MIARGLVDPTVLDEMKDIVERTNVGGKAHESFHKDDATKYTRKDFSWPNALFSELNDGSVLYPHKRAVPL